MSSFHQESRLTGSLNVALLAGTRLQIEQRKPFGKPVRFNVDVACLAPSLSIVTREGLFGLGLATCLTLAIAAFALYGLIRQELLSTLTWSVLAAGMLAMAIALSVAFRIRLFRRLVMRTRCAGLPLLVTPVLKEKRKEMDALLAMVRIRIGEAETKRGFSAEHLRSGELKTIRRLVAEKILPQACYESAKSIILSR